MNTVSLKTSSISRMVTPLRVKPSPVRAARSSTLIVRASDRGGGFMSGFVVGGVVFGVLGFVFAPQISKALLGDDDRLRLPRFLDSDEKQDLEATRQSLTAKIAQLNSAIDDVSAQLKKENKEEATA